MSERTTTKTITTITIITTTQVIDAKPVKAIKPTTVGRTERKPLHWSEEGMTVGDLVGTAGDSNIDDLCNRLCHG